jgi:hypothetical protein
VVQIATFQEARTAANRLSLKNPDRDFFVLASCWSRMARPFPEAGLVAPDITAVDPEQSEAGWGPRPCSEMLIIVGMALVLVSVLQGSTLKVLARVNGKNFRHGDLSRRAASAGHSGWLVRARGGGVPGGREDSPAGRPSRAGMNAGLIGSWRSGRLLWPPSRRIR